MKAICVFSGKIKGIVSFSQNHTDDPVNISLQLTGLGKDQKEHAIHIHEFGNLSKGCMSTGGHFNPYGDEHGLLQRNHHAGDIMSNIIPDKKGNVSMRCNDASISLYGTERNCIIGRSIVTVSYTHLTLPTT